MLDELLALSPLDGRYASEAQPLRDYFSEFAVIRGRVAIELAYLAALAQDARIVRPITPAESAFLRSLAADFSVEDARQVTHLEHVTRHDVKAVESFLRAKLASTSLADVVESLHFGLTSEDINNLVQGLALRDARDQVLLPAIDRLLARLEELARRHKGTLMLARTHGQPAVPTTFGKEMAVFLLRARRQRNAFASHSLDGKLNGAVGNFNALAAAAPQVDWPAFGERFISRLGLVPLSLTTQILPYDRCIEYFNTLALLNSILLGLARDMWQYIADGSLKLKVTTAEAGSSTMPQKVNPIDFENAEGNLGLANALMEHYARKLPVSRLQRDLSDSTVRRTFGSALGHTLIACSSLHRGLSLIDVDQEVMRAGLAAHWEVVAEGAQTILRAAGASDPYEQLKDLTRGQGLTEDRYARWVDGLRVDEPVKERLRALSPLTYKGLAEELVDRALLRGSDPNDI
ncbi:MAG: adenylosuccinate lyase [Anaerolineae bacterium]